MHPRYPAQSRGRPPISHDEWPGGLKAPEAGPLTSRTQKIRARVQPLVELSDPDIFEVNLMGNNMLPLVKRRNEFEELSRQIQQNGTQCGVLPLQISQQDPAHAAQAIQSFLDSLLHKVGLDDDCSRNCQLLKCFLGLWRTHDVDHFRANADGTVVRGKPPPRPMQRDDMQKSPRNALQPLHNQPNQFTLQQPHFAQDVAPGPASIDEKAAALEKIRQRREAARAHSQPARPLTGVHNAVDASMAMLTAPQSADLVRKELAQALLEANSHEDLQSPAFSTGTKLMRSPDSSTSAYSAAVKSLDDVSEKENALELQSAVKGVTRRAIRQAQVLVEQMSSSSKPKTWINCTDEDYGLTFTQSLCGESVFDIAIPKPSHSGSDSATTPRRSNANTSAPAPMESTSTTSNRVAAMAGYTTSFRDIRSKFANAVGSIADQEYASSLLTSQEAQDRRQEAEDAFKPSREVFEYLVSILRDDEEALKGMPSGENVEAPQVRAGMLLCNLCMESPQNREMTVSSGAIDVLSEKIAQAVAEDDFKMQAVVSACLSNIAAERAYKDLVVQSPAIQSLEQVLSSPDTAAATEAAGAFWSLCVENTPDAKTTLATSTIIRSLIKLLSVDEPELQIRAVGTLSEICTQNSGVKTKIANSGAFLGLGKLVGTSGQTQYEITLQRLAACALCNLVANHPGNKRLAKRLSLIGELASLLKRSEVMEIQNAAASCIFNLVCKTDKDELEALGILPSLRTIKSTARMIDTRLLCATNNPNEVASPAFGTF